LLLDRLKRSSGEIHLERDQRLLRISCQHYERRLEAMEGKAMIVCMSRRICGEIYNAITKLRRQMADENIRNRSLHLTVLSGRVCSES